MNRRSKAILISGAIAILATVIISLLCIDDWSGLTGWAFAVMLWSEVALFGGLIFVERLSEKTEQLMIRSALYAIISVYAVISFIVSLLYAGLFKEGGTSFAIIQVALFAVAAILIVISLAASRGVHGANEQTLKAVAAAEAMIERLDKLAACPECETFTSALKKLSEDLRFTDISASAPEDAEIGELISTVELEVSSMNEASPEKIKAALVRLSTLIAQRRISVSAAKKGRL